MTRLIPILFLAVGFAAPAWAQGTRAIVLEPAPIYVLPDASRVPLRTAAVNTQLRMLAEEGAWLKVEFQDPQFGRRVGYVQTKLVRVHRAELQPLDLALREPGRPVRTEAAPASMFPSQQQQPGRMNDIPRANKVRRGFIDVDLGLASAGTKRYSSTVNFMQSGEPGFARADYNLPTGAAFDFGGGYMITPRFGIGLSFLGTAHQDTVDLAIRVPHPFAPNTYATDATVTDGKLGRTEGSSNIQLIFLTDVSRRVAVRLFGGPSFFQVRQDAVSNLVFQQDFNDPVLVLQLERDLGLLVPINDVKISSYAHERIEFGDATGWGVNAGADVSVFLTDVVGVGGFVKYNRGTVSAHDPFVGERMDLRTGGFQTGAGLRMRF